MAAHGAAGIGASILLHVATSRHLKAKRFLSFDAVQRQPAEAEGLKVGP
jgi:hypothetical protein